MSRDLSVALLLKADGSGLDRGLRDGQGRVRRFGQTIKREFDQIGRFWDTLGGKLATVGLGIGMADQLRKSALLDKTLRQTGNTAGFTGKEIGGLREELFAQSKLTGAAVEDLKEGYDAYIAAGQSAKAAREEIGATNIAMAVTGANARTLAGGLTVAGEAFQFDLEQPGMALKLLDEMTVAGRKGNAELENLADIFGRVGVNASSAGLGFEKTLGFIEALSLVERAPERLATLADSTLRLFNNTDYMQTAEQGSKLAAMLLGQRGQGEIEFPEGKALKKLVKSKEFEAIKGGVKFFDDKGGRRDPIAVLKDLRTQFRMMRTDEERTKFLGNVFDKMDLDTVKGLRTLFQGDALDKITEFEKDIRDAGGTLKRELPEAVNNAVDQTNRLKATLREAADGFAQPIDAALARLIKVGLDEKKFSGKQLFAGGAAVAGGMYVGSRVVKGVAGRFMGGVGRQMAETGLSHAISQVTGDVPVRVTNWPSNFGGTGGGMADLVAGAGAALGGKAIFSKLRTTLGLLFGVGLRSLPMMGASAMGSAGLAVAGAGAAGYGAGSAIYGGMGLLDEHFNTGLQNAVGRAITQGFAMLGRREANEALAINENGALQDRLNGRRSESARREVFDASHLPGQIGDEFDRRLAPVERDTANIDRNVDDLRGTLRNDISRHLSDIDRATLGTNRRLDQLPGETGRALREALDSSGLPQEIGGELRKALANLPAQIAAAIKAQPQNITVNVSGGAKATSRSGKDRLDVQIDNGAMGLQ
jgi:TP901 family phage tail tape measure protein